MSDQPKSQPAAGSTPLAQPGAKDLQNAINAVVPLMENLDAALKQTIPFIAGLEAIKSAESLIAGLVERETQTRRVLQHMGNAIFSLADAVLKLAPVTEDESATEEGKKEDPIVMAIDDAIWHMKNVTNAMQGRPDEPRS